LLKKFASPIVGLSATISSGTLSCSSSTTESLSGCASGGSSASALRRATAENHCCHGLLSRYTPLPLPGGEKKRRNGFRSTDGEPVGSASYATSEKRTRPRRPFDAAIVESASSISQ